MKKRLFCPVDVYMFYSVDTKANSIMQCIYISINDQYDTNVQM